MGYVGGRELALFRTIDTLHGKARHLAASRVFENLRSVSAIDHATIVTTLLDAAC